MSKSHTVSKRVLHKIVPSKILLFGEHIINKGAMGLAMPVSRFGGLFRLGSLNEAEAAQSNHSLRALTEYIIFHPTLSELYDTNALIDDVEKGLYFDSDIPQGYGLGSSGALVAAVYACYRIVKRKKPPFAELKAELAAMESFFHGKSSGLDALVCALNKTVLVSEGGMLETVSLPKRELRPLKFFLINTHVARKTSPYVQLFLKKCEEKRFARVVEESLIPGSNMAIKTFLNGHYSDLWKSMQIISELQLTMMPEFIPQELHYLWREGLQRQQFTLKICGAGGGGFIIGLTKKDIDLSLLLGAVDAVPLFEF